MGSWYQRRNETLLVPNGPHLPHHCCNLSLPTASVRRLGGAGVLGGGLQSLPSCWKSQSPPSQAKSIYWKSHHVAKIAVSFFLDHRLSPTRSCKTLAGEPNPPLSTSPCPPMSDLNPQKLAAPNGITQCSMMKGKMPFPQKICLKWWVIAIYQMLSQELSVHQLIESSPFYEVNCYH